MKLEYWGTPCELPPQEPIVCEVCGGVDIEKIYINDTGEVVGCDQCIKIVKVEELK